MRKRTVHHSLNGFEATRALIVFAIAAMLIASAPTVVADATIDAVRAAVTDRISRIEGVAGTFTILQRIDGVEPAWRDVIREPMTTELFWSRSGWSTKERPASGIPRMEVYYNGRLSTEMHYLASGEVDAYIRKSSPELYCEQPLWLFGIRLPFVECRLDQLLADPSAKVINTSDGIVTVTAVSVTQSERRVDAELVFDSKNGYKLVTSITSRESGSDSQPSVMTFNISEWRTVRNELLGNDEVIPVAAEYRTTRGEELLGIATLHASAVRVNPASAEGLVNPQMPAGTRVREYSTPGHSARTYIVGGDQALSAEIARQNIQIDESLRSLAASGVRFDAASPKSRSWIVFLLVGVGCFVLGIVKYWQSKCPR